MDQSSEEVAPAQPGKDRSASRLPRHRRHGRQVAKAAVRAVPVVMLHIDLQHAKKLAAADNQQPVKTLSAHGTDPPFGDGVGVGRLHRCGDDLDPGRAPHVIERPAELGVPVTKQERARAGLLVEDGDQVASLLGNPPSSRVRGDAGQVHPSACEFDNKQHRHALEEDRVDGKEVAGQDPGGLLAQERPPARWSAPGRRGKIVGAQHPPDGAG
jgi:hypothetical protein